MYPKLVALGTDGTIFTGELDQNVWGKGRKASQELANTIERVDDRNLRDRSNHANQIQLNGDIPQIVTDILKRGASLAIVSRNTSQALCDRALYYFKAIDPESGEQKPIIEMVRYDEVVDEPTTEHFKRIHGWSKYDYADMILFDDDPGNDIVQEELGVTVQKCATQEGLTWEIYQEGIERWRRAKASSQQTPNSTILSIAHFNDVYQVTDQKININGQQETINVSKFATLLAGVTLKWKGRSDGRKDGVIVFSGDLFSPSKESSITRGKHIPAIVNYLGVDVGVAGNHEFDFGYPRLKELINDTNFPWLLSNIIDTSTNKVPEPLKEIHVLERGGIRIGFIGLVEKEWIATITGWPENFEYHDMKEVGRRLSVKLRDPDGEYRCDFIIALTHSRIPNDIKLARALFALSPAGQTKKDIASEHGVDLLLGGHDHVYWISKGVTKWDGYNVHELQPDATDDRGDVLVVKSGVDYQDLSEIILTLKDTPAGSVRKKIIQDMTGKRHITRGSTTVNKDLEKIVDDEVGMIKRAMQESICITEVKLDSRSSYIRREESPVANWIADCLRYAYDETLGKLGYGKADGVITCTGDIRADTVYKPGPITLDNLMTLLPYPDPMVIVELDANALWDALESALSRFPKQEGRFPTLSGLRVVWDSSKLPNNRIIGIWLLAESNQTGPNGEPILVDKEEVLRTSARKYLIMIGKYMADGGEGYDALKNKKEVVDAESGQSKGALVKKFLLGAHFLKQKLHEESENGKVSQSKMARILDKVKSHLQQLQQTSHPSLMAPVSFHAFSNPGSRSDFIAQTAMDDMPSVVEWSTSQQLSSAALTVVDYEHMGLLDSYDRQRARETARLHRFGSLSMNTKSVAGYSLFSVPGGDVTTDVDEEEATVAAAENDADKSLPIIHPVVDGRLKNIAKN